MNPPSTGTIEAHSFAGAPIGRDRDQFGRELLRELSGLLESTVGLEEAQGFISRVGGRIGEMMNEEYREAAGTDRLSLSQVAGALVDLKARINGGFEIESLDEMAVVFKNDACPFGSYVEDRESLCMMTSNVFGRISADNLGFANVEITESIATGSDRCRVVVRFDGEGQGRDYYGV